MHQLDQSSNRAALWLCNASHLPVSERDACMLFRGILPGTASQVFRARALPAAILAR
jgi:hypothetical protein